ncbi:hypothetical protein ACW9YV_11510 [Paraburkholderia strydomiana]
MCARLQKPPKAIIPKPDAKPTILAHRGNKSIAKLHPKIASPNANKVTRDQREKFPSSINIIFCPARVFFGFSGDGPPRTAGSLHDYRYDQTLIDYSGDNLMSASV